MMGDTGGGMVSYTSMYAAFTSVSEQPNTFVTINDASYMPGLFRTMEGFGAENDDPAIFQVYTSPVAGADWFCMVNVVPGHPAF
jgi:hypothetical protein